MMNQSTEQFEELLVAYALDALEPEERTMVEDQLSASPEYRRQLAAYTDMLAGVAALSPAVEEPAGHRERMMAKLNVAPAAEAAPSPAPVIVPTMLATTPAPTRRA